jgi:hypothetical protein
VYAFSAGGPVEVEVPDFPAIPTPPGLSPLDFGGSIRLTNSNLSTLKLLPRDSRSTVFSASAGPDSGFFDQGP